MSPSRSSTTTSSSSTSRLRELERRLLRSICFLITAHHSVLLPMLLSSDPSYPPSLQAHRALHFPVACKPSGAGSRSVRLCSPPGPGTCSSRCAHPFAFAARRALASPVRLCSPPGPGTCSSRRLTRSTFRFYRLSINRSCVNCPRKAQIVHETNFERCSTAPAHAEAVARGRRLLGRTFWYVECAPHLSEPR